MRHVAAGLAVLWAVSGGTASAHVEPAREANNRDLKVTPLGDRVRIAYTIYFGDRPGAARRRLIDSNGDGVIDEAEADRFGHELSREVAPAVTVTVDEMDIAPTWSEIHVGLGTPVTSAGPFSVDLIAWVCLPRPGRRHTVRLRDRYALPLPGETGVHIEDSAGIHIDSAHLGRRPLVDLEARWTGAGGPLGEDGLTMVYSASDRAPRPRSGCAAESRRPALGAWPWLAAAGTLVAIGALLLTWRLRRRRRQPP